MSTTITADISAMFSHREPWDVSNSVANLGPNAGALTWQCALEIAARHESWLRSDLADALVGMNDWAHRTGAWTHAEVDQMTDDELLGLFAQNIASELRELGSDEFDLSAVVDGYTNAYERHQDLVANVTGRYRRAADGSLRVDYYTGI